MVVPAVPICNHPAGMLQSFESVAIRALALERVDHALDHAVLLGTVWRDELLLQLNRLQFEKNRLTLNLDFHI